MPTFNLEDARKAGVSDSDIAQELSKASGFNYDSATKAGVSPSSIIDEIQSKKPELFSAPVAKQIPPERTLGQAVTQGVANIPQSVGGMVSGMAGRFMEKPLETTGEMLKAPLAFPSAILGAGLEKVGVEPSPSQKEDIEKYGKPWLDSMTKLLTDWTHAKERIATDPAGVITDLSVLMPGKVATKVVGKTTEALGASEMLARAKERFTPNFLRQIPQAVGEQLKNMPQFKESVEKFTRTKLDEATTQLKSMPVEKPLFAIPMFEDLGKQINSRNGVVDLKQINKTLTKGVEKGTITEEQSRDFYNFIEPLKKISALPDSLEKQINSLSKPMQLQRAVEIGAGIMRPTVSTFASILGAEFARGKLNKYQKSMAVIKTVKDLPGGDEFLSDILKESKGSVGVKDLFSMVNYIVRTDLATRQR